jgi:hypothetical protein
MNQGCDQKKEPSKTPRDMIINLSLFTAEKLILLAVLYLGAMIASHIFAYPDFAIHSHPNNETIEIKDTSKASEDLKKDLSERRTFNITASSYPSLWGFKKYSYPIFLTYSLGDSKGNTTKKIDGISVGLDPYNRQIMVDNSTATVTLTVDTNNVSPGEYTIKICGLGGGGESFEPEKVLDSVSFHTTGEEPSSTCTISINIIKSIKGESVTKKESEVETYI